MNYKFLAVKEIERAAEETDLTVGEVLRTALSEKFTGIKIENKSRFHEITDKDWYKILEKAFLYIKD